MPPESRARGLRGPGLANLRSIAVWSFGDIMESLSSILVEGEAIERPTVFFSGKVPSPFLTGEIPTGGDARQIEGIFDLAQPQSGNFLLVVFRVQMMLASGCQPPTIGTNGQAIDVVWMPAKRKDAASFGRMERCKPAASPGTKRCYKPFPEDERGKG
jgi:hypothetical protein